MRLSVLCMWVAVLAPMSAKACTEIVDVGPSEAEQLMAVLQDAAKSSIAKNAAAERLFCSKDFALKRIGISEYLSNTTDKFARQKIIFEALSTMTALQLEPAAPFNLKGAVKEGEHLTIPLDEPNEENGCLQVNRQRISSEFSLCVKRDHLEYHYSGNYGEFKVMGDGDIAGYVDGGRKETRSLVKGRLE